MPRRPRFYSPMVAYHIIARGNNRETLFRSPADFRYFLLILSELKAEYACDLFHYCLMTNHVHLLMQFQYPEGFQKVPQRLNLRYAKYVARTYQHVGHVFQDRFKSFPVEDNTYLLECGRYIERNPVKAKMVRRPEDYPWSSYSFYARGVKNNLLTCNPAYKELAGSDLEQRRLYARFVSVERPYEDVIEKLLWGQRK